MSAAAGNKSDVPVECAVSAHLSRRDVCFEATVSRNLLGDVHRWNLLWVTRGPRMSNEAALRKAMRTALDLSCCCRM